MTTRSPRAHWPHAVFALLALAASQGLIAAPEPAAKPAPAKPAPQTAAPVKPTDKIPTDEELRKILTPMQYAVVRENATERPGPTSEYWRHKEEGIYVDIVSGKPLFSSKDKFDTDCGWPGFAKPIDAGEIKELSDKSHGMTRIEVRSKTGDSHLGHVFNDGPREMGGLRYCINSAAIRFVPKAKMAEAGYGDYLKIFEEKKK